MALDSFLNVVIPLGILLFLGGIIYSKFENQFKQFFAWIKGLFESGAEKIPESRPVIIYDY